MEPERQQMDVDIVCVGFGPAAGGFLTTLARGLAAPDGAPALESTVAPGMPPQVICYERADDIGFGVSGIVTRGRAIRASFPDLNPDEIPMASAVKQEKVLYLLDPVGASRRPAGLRAIDSFIRSFRFALPLEHDAIELPYTPEFLSKHGGLVMSVGQFNQWVGSQLIATGAVQIWPGTPVARALIEDRKVTGVRLVDQGVEKDGTPGSCFLPGMDIRAALTVVADGPVGVVSRQIDEEIGVPEGCERKDWAVGCKFVIDLPENCDLEPGTVFHTLGYPEPEIFGFFYVHPGRVASAGIFVPSWFTSPVRTSYRYLQHFIQHPFLWRYVAGGRLRSWGAKSLQESGRRGEPFLAGDGYARIGEGSGSTNVLTGSGVDEAWLTGTQLAEAVLELLREGLPFTRANLESTYVHRRRHSWVETEGRVAEKARDGFQHGFLTGLVGMALSGFTKGLFSMPRAAEEPFEAIPTPYEYYRGRIDDHEIAKIREDCAARCVPLHDALMERAGWPAIDYDGQLLVSHQDALLLGGKVQAPAGYADHVIFRDPALCRGCGAPVCIEICSAQAIVPGPDGVPVFDREKCVYCGACLWNCTRALADDSGRTNLEFRVGAGGLHSVEN